TSACRCLLHQKPPAARTTTTATATGVGNRRAAGELAFRFLFDSFILLKNGRPVFEPPVSLSILVWRPTTGSDGPCSSPAPDRALVRGCSSPPTGAVGSQCRT